MIHKKKLPVNRARAKESWSLSEAIATTNANLEEGKPSRSVFASAIADSSVCADKTKRHDRQHLNSRYKHPLHGTLRLKRRRLLSQSKMCMLITSIKNESGRKTTERLGTLQTNNLKSPRYFCVFQTYSYCRIWNLPSWIIQEFKSNETLWFLLTSFHIKETICNPDAIILREANREFIRTFPALIEGR
jgi:hypothetical protein